MALYVGVSNTARKVKKMYVGIADVARKVKKLYVGVAGIARLVFQDAYTKAAYYGTGATLSVAKYYVVGASNDSYAVFAGGINKNGSYQTSADAYNNKLTKTVATALTNSAALMTGISLSNYACFLGNDYYTSSYGKNLVTYNKSLTKTHTASFLTTGRKSAVGGCVGSYAVVAGGFDSSDNYLTSTEAFNSSLTKVSSVVSLSNSQLTQSYGGGAENASYCLFAGNGSYVVTVYNSSLTKSTATNLTISGTTGTSGSRAGNYAIFAGGNNGASSPTYYTTANAYNDSLTQVTAPSLSTRNSGMHTTSVQDSIAIFAGGVNNTADYYNSSLTHGGGLTKPNSIGRAMGSTSIGEYGLFAGGAQGSSTTNVVGVYEVS